jgi:hypothetical protein
LSKPASRIDRQNGPGFPRSGKIPTDTAESTLRFCRALAQQVRNLGTDPAGKHPSRRPGRGETEISFVPIYDEVENIPVLLRPLGGSAAKSFEIVFVEDSSCDQSIPKLSKIAASEPRHRG